MKLTYELGDVVAVRGVGAFSDGICLATGEPVSHIMLVTKVASGKVEVTEALTTVQVHDLATHLRDGSIKHAWRISPKFLTAEQRLGAVEAAGKFVGKSYGYVNIFWQLVDAETRSRWAAEHLAETGHPICSELAEEAEPESVAHGLPDMRVVTPHDYYATAARFPQWWTLEQEL